MGLNKFETANLNRLKACVSTNEKRLNVLLEKAHSSALAYKKLKVENEAYLALIKTLESKSLEKDEEEETPEILSDYMELDTIMEPSEETTPASEEVEPESEEDSLLPDDDVFDLDALYNN